MSCAISIEHNYATSIEHKGQFVHGPLRSALMASDTNVRDVHFWTDAYTFDTGSLYFREGETITICANRSLDSLAAEAFSALKARNDALATYVDF